MRPDLEKLAKEYGAKNLRFFIPVQISVSLHRMGLPVAMTSDSDEEIVTECEVNEERYKMADGYKICLQPINAFPYGENDIRVLCNRTFYQSDLENIMKRDDEYRVYVLVDEDNKYERIRF